MSNFYCNYCGSSTYQPYYAEATGHGYSQVFCSEDCFDIERNEDLEDSFKERMS